MVKEPGPHGQESEVHRGGGGEEGGAGDEHPGAAHQQGQTQPAHVGSELAENSAVEINLQQSNNFCYKAEIFSMKNGIFSVKMKYFLLKI